MLGKTDAEWFICLCGNQNFWIFLVHIQKKYTYSIGFVISTSRSSILLPRNSAPAWNLQPLPDLGCLSGSMLTRGDIAEKCWKKKGLPLTNQHMEVIRIYLVLNTDVYIYIYVHIYMPNGLHLDAYCKVTYCFDGAFAWLFGYAKSSKGTCPRRMFRVAILWLSSMIMFYPKSQIFMYNIYIYIYIVSYVYVYIYILILEIFLYSNLREYKKKNNEKYIISFPCVFSFFPSFWWLLWIYETLLSIDFWPIWVVTAKVVDLPLGRNYTFEICCSMI